MRHTMALWWQEWHLEYVRSLGLDVVHFWLNDISLRSKGSSVTIAICGFVLARVAFDICEIVKSYELFISMVSLSFLFLSFSS